MRRLRVNGAPGYLRKRPHPSGQLYVQTCDCRLQTSYSNRTLKDGSKKNGLLCEDGEISMVNNGFEAPKASKTRPLYYYYG